MSGWFVKHCGSVERERDGNVPHTVYLQTSHSHISPVTLSLSAVMQDSKNCYSMGKGMKVPTCITL